MVFRGECRAFSLRLQQARDACHDRLEQRKPRQTRQKSEGQKGKRPQTMRAPEDQRVHAAARVNAWKQRNGALRAAAIERTQAFVALMSAPITGHGVFGQYTLAQMLALEFALILPSQFSDNVRMLAALVEQ